METNVNTDVASVSEDGWITAAVGVHDTAKWHCHTKVEKFNVPTDIDPSAKLALDYLDGVGQARLLRDLGVTPEVVEVEGNLLMFGGVSNIWQYFLGNGTATANQTLTYFNNGNAALGVGDSTAAEAGTQTDLQAATNKIRVGMDATFPQHTPGTSSGAASITLQATFSTSQANFAWQEWGVFNSATAGLGRMLNRKVESLGTKTAAAAWTFTITLTLA